MASDELIALANKLAQDVQTCGVDAEVYPDYDDEEVCVDFRGVDDALLGGADIYSADRAAFVVRPGSRKTFGAKVIAKGLLDFNKPETFEPMFAALRSVTKGVQA